MDYQKINSKTKDLFLDVMVAPVENPLGIVQLVHGMCEYKERYLDFISYLNKHGYIVVIHDHPGHGKSVIKTEDLGYFYSHDINDIIEDVYLITTYIKTRYPGLPVYLFGHSMGSLIVRNYLHKYDQEIDALIVCGSPSKNNLARLGKLICKLIAKTKGDKYHSMLLHKIAMGPFNRKYTLPNEWICSDSEVVKQYNDNPLCNFTFSVNGFENLFSLMQQTYTKIGYHVNESLPILFIAGKNDPCIINEKAFNQAVNYLCAWGYKNVTAKLFEQMRHEILNETNKEIVYQTIIDFLEEKK